MHYRSDQLGGHHLDKIELTGGISRQWVGSRTSVVMRDGGEFVSVMHKDVGYTDSE
jgi:hypothetical protein